MGKKKHQPSISVSAATYARVQAAAEKYGCTKADIVREACAPILEHPAPPR